LSACGGGSSTDTSPVTTIDPDTNSSCEIAVQNQWVYNNMLDYYLFYDQVPVVNPQSFASSEELLTAVRFTERDPFSFLTDSEAATLQFEEGREFGLGYRWAEDNDDIPRLTRVVSDGPFGRADLERGDIIVSLNGIAWDDVPSEDFRTIFYGTPDAPVTSSWQFEKRDTGDVVTMDFTATEYAINTVLHKEFLTNPNYSGTVGYLAFSRFLETSAAELQTVFQEFNDRNITDLVLDLRYNSGGRVSIAEYLASLIAGSSRANQLLYQYEYNDKYTTENYSLLLQDNVGDLGLSRVIILARGNTASSSEIVIAGLQPHLEVVTLGSTTSGKPYVQRGRNRCGRQLNAVEAEGFNAAGVSVFGGIPATCYAADDRTKDFGLNDDTSELEGMLKSALDYIVEGTCLTAPVLAVQPTQSVQARNMVDQSQPNDTSEKQGFIEIGGAF